MTNWSNTIQRLGSADIISLSASGLLLPRVMVLKTIFKIRSHRQLEPWCGPPSCFGSVFFLKLLPAPPAPARPSHPGLCPPRPSLDHALAHPPARRPAGLARPASPGTDPGFGLTGPGFGPGPGHLFQLDLKWVHTSMGQNELIVRLDEAIWSRITFLNPLTSRKARENRRST